MKNTIKNKFGASLIALAFSFIPAEIQAQTCATLPACISMGYNKSTSDCAGQPSLKCPFDTTKLFCIPVSLSSNCVIGDILYSDKSCSIEAVSGKTPIGVVFNTDKKLAIALKTEKKYWSTEYFDVPGLTNISSGSAATADWQGKANTTTVLNYCKSNSKSCPAFDYVNSYKTTGTNAGDWYLPAMGELNAIYGVKGALNATLSKVGGTQLPDNYHWSSSEYSNYTAWAQSFSDGNINGYSKDLNRYVRPVLAF